MSETPSQGAYYATETPTDHEHDLVWVTSPDMEQARQKCKDCPYRSEWVDLPPELQPQGTTVEEDWPVDVSVAGGTN